MGKSPFSMGKSPFSMGKSPFLLAKSPLIHGPWLQPDMNRQSVRSGFNTEAVTSTCSTGRTLV